MWKHSSSCRQEEHTVQVWRQNKEWNTTRDHKKMFDKKNDEALLQIAFRS